MRDWWYESALFRSLKRGATAFVLIGLAFLVRSTFAVFDADATEPIYLPERYDAAPRVPEVTAYSPLATPGQRLPPARPVGLLLKTRYEAPLPAPSSAPSPSTLATATPPHRCP